MEGTATAEETWPTTDVATLVDVSNVRIDTGGGFDMEILNIIAGGLGILGNAFALLVIFYYKKMRKRVGSGLIINQCVVDLSASAMITIYHLRNVLVDNAFEAPYGGAAGDLFCKVWAAGVCHWSLMIASTYNLLAITLERYLMIVRPLYHKVKVTREVVIVACLLPWLIGIALQAPWAVASSTLRGTMCSVYSRWPHPNWFRANGIFATCFSFFIPAAVMVGCFTRMIWELRYKKRFNQVAPLGIHDATNKKILSRVQMNLTKTCVIIVVAFICCWVVGRVFWFLYTVGADVDMRGDFNFAALLLVDLNCSVNPFIYIFSYEEFKRGVRHLFTCSEVGGKQKSSSSKKTPTGQSP